MGTARTRRCPRCGGRLFLEPNLGPWDLTCLWCGFAGYIEVATDSITPREESGG